MAKYLSPEWVEQGRRHAEQDERLRALIQGVKVSILCVIEETPDHADEVIFIEFDDGKLGELYSGTKADFERSKREATFSVTGPYDTYVLIQEGQLSQTSAVTRGLLRFQGAWTKALRHLRAMEELNRALREVPTEF